MMSSPISSPSSPKYRLAIFDLDGTLADSFPWFQRVVNDVAREYGFRQVTPEDVDMLRRASSRDILKHLDVPLWKLPKIAARMRKLKQAQLHDIPLFPGATKMLAALAQGGMRLALVSSDNEANARTQLGPETARLFSDYNCGASLFGKARKFKQVLIRAGVSSHHAIAIGDEIRDLEAARATGIAFGAVSWGYTDGSALQALKPDEFFSTIGQITSRFLPVKK